MTDLRTAPRRTPTVSPIAERRIAAGLTQNQLAQLVGVAPQHIGRWERGERKPKLDALKKIAESLDCDISDLI